MTVSSNVMLVMKTSDVERIHLKGIGWKPGMPPFMKNKRMMAVDTYRKSEISLQNNFQPCLIRLDKDVLVRVEVVNDSRSSAYLKVSPLHSSVRKNGVETVLNMFKNYFSGEVVVERPHELWFKEIRHK